MMPFKIGYSIKEAFQHFGRNVGTSFGAIVTIFLSLFIIGLFAGGSVVVNNIVGDVENKVTIQAFLSDEAEQSDIQALQDSLQANPDVQSVTFKSKDEALAEYKETMTTQNAQDAIQQLDGQNPVPASLIIELKDPQQVEKTAQALINDSMFQTVADVPDNPSASVQYGQDTVKRLFTLTNYARVITVVLVTLLTFIAFVFINNTIRLSIMARSLEIGIMRLVGANNSFIRGPFLMEGILQAIIGVFMAVLSLELLRHFAFPKIQESLPFFNLSIPSDVLLIIYAALLGIGLVIGILGSALAMRRYLKV